MKQSTDSRKDKTDAPPALQSGENPRGRENESLRFAKWVLLFLVVMLTIYLYYVLADLSTAPKFVYSQF